METADVTAEAMRPLVGRAFTVVGHDVALTFVEVDEHDTGNPQASSFSLLFDGPNDVQLAQGTWDLTTDDESLSLFLVPIGPRGSDRMGYESIFTRQSESDA